MELSETEKYLNSNKFQIRRVIKKLIHMWI